MPKINKKMAKKAVTVIFDRLGAAKRSGRGKIEIRVYLSANVRKYIVVGETSRMGVTPERPCCYVIWLII